jgi:hypothetical protein
MKPLLLVLGLAILFSCKPTEIIDPCKDALPTEAKFETYEILNDTMYLADTIFTTNTVKFKAIGQYDTTSFTLSGDPRSFNASEFNLPFGGFVGNVNVTFNAKKAPNTTCFPGDVGVYTKSKTIRLTHPVDKSKLTISPMVGKYKGSYDIAPTDSFIVSIDYFDSSKYPVGTFGSKNFYWISNFPKGFRSTWTILVLGDYPELTFGYRPDNLGYKSFAHGHYNYSNFGLVMGNINKTNDTLTIVNRGGGVPNRKFIGKRI